MKMIILENVNEIDSNAFQQWVDIYAPKNYDEVKEKFGLLEYSEKQYEELFHEISNVDAIAMHTSLSNSEQNEKMMRFFLSLDEIPKIFISYISYNKLTWFLNNEFKGYQEENRKLLKKLINKHPEKIFEITYNPVVSKGSEKESFFSTEFFSFHNLELISSDELDYITHAFRRNNSHKKEDHLKEELIGDLSSNMEIWGYSKENIEDLCNHIKNFELK